MALIRCRKCGHMVSDKAKACPKCGAANNDIPDSNLYEQNLNKAVNSGYEIAGEKTCVKNVRNKSLSIILVVILCLVIAGALFFFLQYNSGGLAADENNLSMDSVSSVEEEVAYNTEFITGPIYISGTLGEMPFTLDLDISEEGEVTGKYWNVLYDIPLPVSGNRLSNNDFDLILGKGSSQSSLILNYDGENSFIGRWGQKEKPIHAEMCYGRRPAAPLPTGDYMRLRIKGNGINKIARLGDDYFYYEDQGADIGHTLKVSQRDSENYILYDTNESKVADIDLYEGMLGDVLGKTFEVTILKQREDNIIPTQKATVSKEEDRGNTNSVVGPNWLQGRWILRMELPNGLSTGTYTLMINGDNAILYEGKKEKYNGKYKIADNNLIVGPHKYIINDDLQRLEYYQFCYHKEGGTSSDSYNGSFYSADAVMRYLADRTFYSDGTALRIRYDAVYVDGRAMTGAPRVSSYSGNSAVVVANSPYAGGNQLTFRVNASDGTVRQGGDTYYYR